MRPLLAVFDAFDESYTLRSLDYVANKLLCIARFHTLEIIVCGLFVNDSGKNSGQ